MGYMRDASGRRLDTFEVGEAGDADVWSVVSSRPAKMVSYTSSKAAAIGDTSRLSEVAPFDLVAVRLVYANMQNLAGSSSEFPGYCPVRVKAAVHRAGASAPDRGLADPYYPVRFAGREFGIMEQRGTLVSDKIPVGIAEGERWWHESYVDCLTGAAPSAPTLTAVAGGAVTAGTYYLAITYVYPDGTESQVSAEASVATSAGNLSIQVTSPAAVAGCIGYRVYGPVGAANSIKFENASWPMAPFGNNITITGTSTNNALSRIVRAPVHAGWPLGQGLLAGVGEVNVNARDYTDNPVAQSGVGQYGGVFSPILVLGIAADGRVHPSACIAGDSINAGAGDRGFGGGLGGAVFRALANQTAQVPFDSTRKPHMGFMMTAQGGDTAAQDNTAAGGARRRALSEYATSTVDNMATNDLGTGSAVVYAAKKVRLDNYAGRKGYFALTLDPRAGASTDGYKTVANQSMASTAVEGDRRAINNSLRTTTGAVAIVGETLFRSPGTATPATNFAGGDGTATKFYTAHPFLSSSLVVKVNDVTQTLTTHYTIEQTATINGGTHGSRISFVSAPANGATVTADYTKAPSLGGLTGMTGVFDTAAEVEVDAAGAKVANGGWWKPGTQLVTGTTTASTGSVLTDTSKTWTVDAYRGKAVRITADATTPAAVGLVAEIQSNTATALTLGSAWSTTPSVGASYEILDAFVIDGTHSTSRGHLAKSLVIDHTLLV